ncbi:hypothetical protein D3C81_1499940 [compost metagenome]
MQAPVQEYMPSTCCGSYHPYVYSHPMHSEQVAGVYTGYPDGYGMAAFQVQPNLPGAPLGGFGGAEEVKGFLEREFQSTDNIGPDAIQTDNAVEVGDSVKTKAKSKKEVKVSGSTIKNTSKRARGGSGISSSNKRMNSEAAKGRTSGRRSPWINN